MINIFLLILSEYKEIGTIKKKSSADCGDYFYVIYIDNHICNLFNYECNRLLRVLLNSSDSCKVMPLGIIIQYFFKKEFKEKNGPGKQFYRVIHDRK